MFCVYRPTNIVYFHFVFRYYREWERTVHGNWKWEFDGNGNDVKQNWEWEWKFPVWEWEGTGHQKTIPAHLYISLDMGHGFRFRRIDEMFRIKK